MVDTLRDLGFSATMPAGTFYLYVRMPKGVRGGRQFANAEEFSEFLITEKLISTVPWDDAGPYLRFSATFEAKGKADEKRVLAEFKKRMNGLAFEF
jgi:LL-diaminopimelate aminotransferase